MPMTFLKPAFTIGSAFWLLFANTSLESPRLGYVRLANQDVWSVRGLAGSFYFGQRTSAAVSHHAFNGSVGVLTLPDQAQLIGPNGEILRAARIGGKVLQIGLSTIEDSAYVLTETEFWHFDRERADRFAAPVLEPDEKLIGLTGAGNYIDLATVAGGQITIRRRWLDTDEELIREVFSGNPQQFVFLSQNMALWSDQGVITLRRGDGSTIQVDSGVASYEMAALGKNMIHVAGEDGRQFTIRISGEPANMRLLQLPENPE
jgi:hypothetical protein